jgi:D-lactate dehydrogenase
MKIAIFSTKKHDRDSLTAANLAHSNSTQGHELCFFETQLNAHTALLAKGMPVVCPFVNDEANAEILKILAANGTRLLALRAAGFNNVDLKAAADLGIAVVRVPAYSPYAVAEHTVAMILMLNRKLYRAYNRVRDDNFSLEGLLGFDLYGGTIGIIGTGRIGMVFAQIMHGFGCSLLGYDKFPNPQFATIDGARYVSLPELLAKSDVISLHCPLVPENHHLIDDRAIAQMKPGVMLINTSRGGLVDTEAVIAGIKSAQIGYLGIDVYEQEADLFSEDLSGTIIQDDNFQLLKSFPNVVITAHQAFFTRNALQAIAETTLANITEFAQGQSLTNQIQA